MNSDSVLAGIFGIDDQRERHGGHQRDRRKILDGIVAQLLVERLVDGKRGRGRHQQRVAVGLRPCHLFGAERGRGSRLVLDNDGRVQSGLELIGDQPAEEVGGAAGRIGHDHLDGPGGIGRLRQRSRPARRQQGEPPATSGNRLAARQQHGFSHRQIFLIAVANQFNGCRDISKARKSNPAMRQAQQPQYNAHRLIVNATLVA